MHQCLRQGRKERLKRVGRGGRTEDRRGDVLLDVGHQLAKHLEGLALVFDQRVALTIGPQPHPLAQGVHRAQVVLPLLIDALQHNLPLHHGHRALVLHLDLELVGTFDLIVYQLGNRLGIGELGEVTRPQRHGEGQLDPLHEIMQCLLIRIGREPLGLLDDDVVQDVVDLLAVVLGTNHVAAEAVNHLALAVHHVVILERAFANRVVVLFDATLGRLDRAVEPAMLQLLPLFESEALHDTGDTVRPEQAHQVILERDVEARRSRIALARAAPAQLAVDPARFVPLGGNHMQSTGILNHLGPQGLAALPAVVEADLRQNHLALNLNHALAQLDIRTTSRHVRCDRNGARLAGAGHDLGLGLVVLGIQHVVHDTGPLEHTAQQLGGVHRHGPHQDRLAMVVVFANLLDHGGEFLALRLVDPVIRIDPAYRPVGRNHHDIQGIDVAKLARLGFGCTGHAGQLLIHAEVVLDRDRGKGLGLALDLDPLFGLDGLVQAVTPAAPGQDTSGELVDDHDAVILHHVADVLLIQAVRPDELVDIVNLLAAIGVGLLNLLAHAGLFLLGNLVALAIQLRHGRNQIGQHVGVRIGRIERFTPLLGQAGIMSTLIDCEV